MVTEFTEETGYTRTDSMGAQFLRTRTFLYVIIGFLAVLSIGLLIGVIVASSRDNSSCGDCPSNGKCTACDAAGCILDAFQTLQVMDRKTDPCGDFYEYTCGQFDQVFRAPDYKSVYGVAERAEDALFSSLLKDLPNFDDDTNANVAVRQARLFYNTCISDQNDYSGQLVNQLNEAALGGWPLLMLYNETTNSLDTLEAVLGQLMGFWSADYATTVFNNGIFKIFIRKNEKQNNAIYLDEPELGLDASYLLGTDQNSKDKVAAYTTFITDVATAMNAQEYDLESRVNDIITFEKNLAQNLNTPEQQRDQSWNEMTWSESVIQLNYIGNPGNYVTLLDILNPFFGPDVNITGFTDISLLQKSSYMNNYMKTVLTADSANRGVAKSYVMWRYVQFMSWHAGGPLRDSYNKFQTTVNGIQHTPNIEDTCVRLTNSLLSFAIGNVYCKNNYDPDSIEKVASISDNIKNVFLERIDYLAQYGYLNGTTADAAKDKMKLMNVLIGRPDWIMDNTSLDNHYNFDDKTNLEQGHFDNMQTLSKVLIAAELRLSDEKPVDTTRWITPPVSIDAHYDPVLNSITLPMGVLQNPYFMPDSLNQSNYAKLGIIIAREILHGFNVYGHQLDGSGKFVDWWTNDAETYFFTNVTECLKQQYSDYSVNGDQTLDENFADNGAILIAYQAADLGNDVQTLPGFLNFTNDKLFFIQYSSMHCTFYSTTGLANQIATGLTAPNQYRVKGTVQNSKEFSNAFNCNPITNITVCDVM